MPAKKKPAPAAKPPPTMLAIRGLEAADHEALLRAVGRRKAAIGGYVSLNTTVLGLLRYALAAEDAAGAVVGGAT